MKLLGLALISAIPILLGFWQKSRLDHEGHIKEGLIRFFEHTSFEIESFLRPQEEIFSSFECEALEKAGFLPSLRFQVQKDPSFALDRCMTDFLEEVTFTPREKRALTDFCKNFGMQSKCAQLNDCQKLLSILKKEEEGARAKREADGAVARTGGLCIGVGIFILLI